MRQFALPFLLFAAFSVFALRGWMALFVRCAMSKSERKRYRQGCSALNRWFFISTHDFLKDKDSKSEGKIIRYSRIARGFRVINVLLHTAFAIAVAAMLLHLSDADDRAFKVIVLAYLAFWGCAVFALGVIETVTHWKYHRSRYPW